MSPTDCYDDIDAAARQHYAAKIAFAASCIVNGPCLARKGDGVFPLKVEFTKGEGVSSYASAKTSDRGVSLRQLRLRRLH